MNRETRKFVQSLPCSSLDVVEISGDGWSGSQFGFRSYRNVWYPEHDICSAPIGSEICDLVILEQVLEHLQFPDRALRNCLEMLRPGGWVLVTTPFLIRYHPQPLDLFRWTADGMRVFLAQAGFGGVVADSWGNRECLLADMRPGPEWTYFDPEHHSLANEPEFPIAVWAYGNKPEHSADRVGSLDRAQTARTWPAFAQDKWLFRCAPGNAAHLLFPSDDLDHVRVDVEIAATSAGHDIQLNQPRISVTEGQRYEVRFRARADEPRTLLVGFSQAHDPWLGLGLYAPVGLTAEWRDCQLFFVATASDLDGRIHFDAGGSAISFEISGLVIN